MVCGGKAGLAGGAGGGRRACLQVLGFTASRLQGSGFRAQGSGFRVQGLGFTI
jgi:hypothetical protein